MELERENEIKAKNNINIGSRFLSELNDTDSEGINKFSLFGVMKQKRTKYTYNSHIKKANEKWWEYWNDYWKLRNSKDAYEKDPILFIDNQVSPLSFEYSNIL